MNLSRLLVQSLLWRGIYFFTILILNVVLARYLKASGSGWVYYLTNWFGLILLVASFSMESAVTYYASNEKVSNHKLAWWSVVWTLIVALVIFSVLYFYFAEVKNVDEINRQRYIYFALTYIVGILWLNFFAALFYAQKNFFLPNIIMITLNVILILAFLYPRLFPFDILDVYFFFFLITGISLLLAYVINNKSWQHVSLPGKSDSVMIFRYAMVALAANLVFFLVYRIDYWFVRNSHASTPQDLGNYIQVSKLGQMLLIVPQILASVVFPQTASGISRAEVNKKIIIISRLLTQLYIVGFVIILLAGKQLFPFVFGDTFNNMYIPMLILLPGMLALSILVLLSAYFAGKGKVSVNLKGALMALVVVTIGNYFLVDRYGIYAAAIISSIGYTVNLAYALVQFYRDYDIRFSEFFAWRSSDYGWLTRLLTSKNEE